MVRIGDVWDSATDVLAGRAGMLAAIAGVAFVLPAAVSSAVQAWGGGAPGAVALGGLVGLAGLVLSIWGHLAAVAVASDPATTRGEAQRLAWRRLPAALLVALVLGGLVFALLIPAALILVGSGFDVAAATAASQRGGALPAIAPGAAALLLLYGLVLVAIGLWVSARLYLLYPIVLHERPAMAAFGRSLGLTRGLTWPLIGVTLLFGVAGLVAAVAAKAVVGLVAALIVGAGPAATFAAALAWSVVTAAWVVVVQVFAARLYAAVASGGSAMPHP